MNNIKKIVNKINLMQITKKNVLLILLVIILFYSLQKGGNKWGLPTYVKENPAQNWYEHNISSTGGDIIHFHITDNLSPHLTILFNKAQYELTPTQYNNFFNTRNINIIPYIFRNKHVNFKINTDTNNIQYKLYGGHPWYNLPNTHNFNFLRTYILNKINIFREIETRIKNIRMQQNQIYIDRHIINRELAKQPSIYELYENDIDTMVTDYDLLFLSKKEKLDDIRDLIKKIQSEHPYLEEKMNSILTKIIKVKDKATINNLIEWILKKELKKIKSIKKN